MGNTGYGGSFAQTEFTVSEGKKETTFHAGDVVRSRLMDGNFSAFCDAVLLGFTEDGYAKLARPYVYASSVGTVGPTVLTGVETYIVPCKLLVECFEHVECDGHRISR